jgi:CubicO group peptidase (beta-lactamase class C family)
MDLLFGEDYQWYDLASLTKIIFTVPVVYSQLASAEGFERDLSETLHWLPRGRCRLGSILAHQNGLKWWSPYYKRMKSPSGRRSDAIWTEFQAVFRRSVKRQFATLRPGQPAVYSDLDFFLLGDWLTTRTGRSLAGLWNTLRDQMNWSEVDFRPVGSKQSGASACAPTEICPWRRRSIQGEVHDPNAWALGGVAPHAGLFGTLEGVGRYGLSLRRAIRSERQWGPVVFSVLSQGLKRPAPRGHGDWAHGFSLPSRPGASCGPRFSLKSIGHLGFTGTSIWYDPIKDLLVVILSNRTFPTAKNVLIRKWRPLLHTAVVQTLEQG